MGRAVVTPEEGEKDSHKPFPEYPIPYYFRIKSKDSRQEADAAINSNPGPEHKSLSHDRGSARLKQDRCAAGLLNERGGQARQVRRQLRPDADEEAPVAGTTP
ncbi:hypothetical protein AAHA92_25162 [Salvia divinorum]|uniref:Uncharacterized protein n=1 Tax=Salvia divinorum TaxID=28513 RepID=A0ABD1GAE4_SALDI